MGRVPTLVRFEGLPARRCITERRGAVTPDDRFRAWLYGQKASRAVIIIGTLGDSWGDGRTSAAARLPPMVSPSFPKLLQAGPQPGLAPAARGFAPRRPRRLRDACPVYAMSAGAGRRRRRTTSRLARGTSQSRRETVVACHAAGPEPAASSSLAWSGLKKTRSATTALTVSSGRSTFSCAPRSLCSTGTMA
jgi:hypothetical protein